MSPDRTCASERTDHDAAPNPENVYSRQEADLSLEETLGALIDAKLAPVREDLERVAGELAALRKALPPLLVPLKEAAERMRVSEKTARRRVRAGEWPSRRDGRKVLVDLSALRPMTNEEVARTAQRLRTLP